MNPKEIIHIKVTKQFKVPVEKVFDAWLDTDFLSKWMFGPDVRARKLLSWKTILRKAGIFLMQYGETVKNLTTWGPIVKYSARIGWFLPGVWMKKPVMKVWLRLRLNLRGTAAG